MYNLTAHTTLRKNIENVMHESIIASDGFTRRTWPKTLRNSFLWRLIIYLKFAKLRRGCMTSQFTLKRAKMPTS